MNRLSLSLMCVYEWIGLLYFNLINLETHHFQEFVSCENTSISSFYAMQLLHFGECGCMCIIKHILKSTEYLEFINTVSLQKYHLIYSHTHFDRQERVGLCEYPHFPYWSPGGRIYMRETFIAFRWVSLSHRRVICLEGPYIDWEMVVGGWGMLTWSKTKTINSLTFVIFRPVLLSREYIRILFGSPLVSANWIRISEWHLPHQLPT